MPFAGYDDFAACVRANSKKKDARAYCATIMRKVESMEPRKVSEVLDVSEAVFTKDEETGKMSARVKIIQAGKAKGKNRNYSSKSLRKAAKEGVYDGIRMFVNHSDRPPTKRSVGELVSAVESTEYDPQKDAIFGNVEFFDAKFYDYAQRAKKHIGVSADHRIRVNYVKEGAQTIEDVQEIVGAHSVDWVVYPAAGGEIVSFARESEGENEVEWTDITLDQIKEHAPDVLTAYQAELKAKETEPDPEPDPPEEPENKKKAQESVTMTRADIEKLVQEQVTSIQSQAEDRRTKQTNATKQVREFVAKSGLPPRTQARIVNNFADELSYNEKAVQESVDEAKAELAEAGKGPRITGQGATITGKEGEGAPATVSVRESVEALFIKPKATTAASQKES